MTYYSDKLSQESADGAIVLAQNAVPTPLIQAVQGNILTNALLQHRIARSISDGYVDVFEDDSGVNYADSSGIIYDAENKVMKTDLSSSVVTTFDSLDNIEQEDLKGTITYWEKISTGKGRFKTASNGSVVTVGDWINGEFNPAETNALPLLSGPDAQLICSHEYSAYPVWHICDGNDTSYWGPYQSSAPWWLVWTPSTPVCINKWRLRCGGADYGDHRFMPMRFYLEGYDGSSWVELDTTYKLQDYGWANILSTWFTFRNDVSYESYRVTLPQDAASDIIYPEVSRIELVAAIPSINPSIIPGALINDLYTICHIEGDGSASDSVWLDSDPGSSFVVESVHGLTIKDGKIQPNQADKPISSIWTRAGAGLSYHAETTYANISTRMLLPSTIVNKDGSGFRVGLSAANNTVSLVHVSFVERDGTSINGTTVPTEITFNSGQHGVTISPYSTVYSDLITYPIRSAKNYFLNYDYAAVSDTNTDNSAGSPYTIWYNHSVPTQWNLQNFTSDEGPYSRIALLEDFQTTELITHSTPALAIAAGSSVINTSTWSSLSRPSSTVVTPIQTISGSSTVYWAVGFNHGDADEVWGAAPTSFTWRSVARLNSGTWEYRMANDSWAGAPENSRPSALTTAMGITENQMTNTQLAAITNANWATCFESGLLSYACLLAADGNDVPAVESVTSYYVASSGELVSVVWPTNETVTKASISFLMGGVGPGDSVYAYARSDEISEWTPLLLSIVATNTTASGVNQYASSVTTLSGAVGTTFETKLKSDAVAGEWNGVCGMYGN